MAGLLVVHPPCSADAGMFDARAEDPGHAPWIKLRNSLNEFGYEIQTTYRARDRLAEADWVLFMNMPLELKPRSNGLKPWLKRLISRSDSPAEGIYQRCKEVDCEDRLALFLWEPEVVMSENFDPRLHRHFARVFTWQEDLIASGGRYRSIAYPQAAVVTKPIETPFLQRKLLTNFSGNKHSTHPLELYSARVEVIRYMEATQPDAFDHYGPGWGAEFPLWKGMVPSKHDIYPAYRFGLCYENMQSVAGYVTEKIFDCIRAGTVPIYWGAPNIEQYVDKEVFIDRTAFSSTAHMVEHLNSMNESTWLDMRAAGQRYLESERFAKFLPDAFVAQIISGLELKKRH